MWTKRISYTMWPVGQGLFTQADIWVGRKFFRLVCDCGTRTKVSPQISASFPPIRNRGIDLLVISHFHTDHVSLIPKLLKNAGQIHKVWMPYLTPEQRLLFAISNVASGLATGASVSKIQEMSALVLGGPEWFESRGSKVRQIGGELPETEEQSPVDPSRINGPDHTGGEHEPDSKSPDEIKLGPVRTNASIFERNSDFKAVSASIKASRGRHIELPVELLTWVRPIEGNKQDSMMTELGEWLKSVDPSWIVSDLIDNNEGRIVTGKFNKLAKAISAKANQSELKRIYKILNPDLNDGSLFLLARPTNPVHHFNCRPRIDLCPCCLPLHILRMPAEESPAILWTGDALTDTLDQLLLDATDQLEVHLKATILHQVPHHGAASSLSQQWLNTIGKHWSPFDPISLISAGRSNTYGHPSPEVLWRCPSKVISEGSPPFEASLVWR